MEIETSETNIRVRERQQSGQRLKPIFSVRLCGTVETVPYKYSTLAPRLRVDRRNSLGAKFSTCCWVNEIPQTEQTAKKTLSF
jgi:hypothetical protein